MLSLSLPSTSSQSPPPLQALASDTVGMVLGSDNRQSWRDPYTVATPTNSGQQQPSLGSPPPLETSGDLPTQMIQGLPSMPSMPSMPSADPSDPRYPPGGKTLQTRFKELANRLAQDGVGEVNDAAATFVSVFLRIVRIMLLWVILYFVDRAYQAVYIENVFSKPVDATADVPAAALRPALWTMMPAVLLIELVLLTLVFLILLALKKRFHTPKNDTFILDDALMARLLREYLVSTVVMLPIGMLVGHAMQSCKELRYRDDGLRGIRALAVLLLLVAVVVVLAPLPTR
jgi:hypothetical protein